MTIMNESSCVLSSFRNDSMYLEMWYISWTGGLGRMGPVLLLSPLVGMFPACKCVLFCMFLFYTYRSDRSTGCNLTSVPVWYGVPRSSSLELVQSSPSPC